MHEPERISLARLPTPMCRLERLGAALDGADIWIKRDDLTGLELSGNKIRKLEYIAADARAAACDTLVTEGTPQSNHCRATAAVCAKLGMQAVLLFRPPAEKPQGNHLLDVLYGAEIRSYPADVFTHERDRIVNQVIAELQNSGRKPRWTPMGASEPLGCWGYIRAAAELRDQLASAGIGACDLVVAISSGATYAGLLLGTLIHKLDAVRVWAVPVSDDAAFHRQSVLRLARETIEHYALPVTVDEEMLRLLQGYVGEGYAVPYDAANHVIRELARLEGILLDPVYTGKAFCGLVEAVVAGALGRERPVVFVHTGGIFSNFAWPDTLLGSRNSV